VFGLSFMFDILSAAPLKRVTVHAEPDKVQALRQHLFSPLLFPVDPPFDLLPLAPEIKLADGGVLTHFPLRHPGGSVGFRIDWPDRSLAYVTDTVAAPGVEYIQAIQGVDLLIHECHFADDQADQAELTGHSCLTPVAQVAAEAGVGRMILVHINPLLARDSDLPLRKVKKIFSELTIGKDGTEVEF
jgi:ribonuclease Z